MEVLRGPQGALYGRNALGGAMNVISKKPDFEEFDVQFRLKAGELDLFGGDMVVNIPVSETFAARVGYVNEDRDDFYKDVRGDPVDVDAYQAFRLGLRWKPAEAWDVAYFYDQMEQELTNTVMIVPTQREALGSEFNTFIDTAHSVENDVQNHNLLIDVELGGGTFSSVSNYRDRDVYTRSDQDYTFPPGRTGLNRQAAQAVDNQSYFQELRYVADGTDQFNWMIGGDYLKNDHVELTSQWPGILGLPSDVGLWGNAQTRRVGVPMEAWALYGSAEYTFADLPVSISAEVRYAEDEVGGSVLQRRRRLTDPQTDFTEPPKTFRNLPWGVTVSYKFPDGIGDLVEEALAYAKVATSYRHGGLNLNAGTPDLDRYVAILTYDEEESFTYELGWKSTFAGGLTFNAAAFFTVYEEFLNTDNNGCPELCTLLDPDDSAPLGFHADGTRVEFDADGNLGEELPRAWFINNIGEAEAWGLEAEFLWRRAFDNGALLNLRAGWSRQVGEVTEIASGVSPASQFAKGKSLPYMRPEEYKASVVYRLPLPGLSGTGGFLNGATLLATANLTIENGGVRSLPRPGQIPWFQDNVQRLDAQLGLETDQWALVVRGSNILDADYETFSLGTTPTVRASRYRRVDPAYYALAFSWRLR